MFLFCLFGRPIEYLYDHSLNYCRGIPPVPISMSPQDQLAAKLNWKEGFLRIIEIPSGWVSYVEELHNKLVLLDPDYKVAQIKSKFGGLRFYASSDVIPYRDLEQLISATELRIAELPPGQGFIR